MSIFDGPILVTGGAGMIGSALLWALNQRGHENIIVADFLESDDKWKNLAPLRFVRYIQADQLFSSIDSGELNAVQCIFHLGACSSTTETNAKYLIENNYEFTWRLAQWAIKTQKRFVYASTAAVYGDGSAGMSDAPEQFGQHVPLNMYGYSKQLFDLHAHQQGWLDQIVGLRYFNVFGPNEYHKQDMQSMVAKAYRQIHDQGHVQLFRSYRQDVRDGYQQRDFLYVKDAVDMTIHLAQHCGANGIFNLGSGKSSSWVELAESVFAAANKPVNIKFIDMPANLQKQYQYFTRADISRLRETGWNKTSFTLADAVGDYVRIYLSHNRHLGQEIESNPRPLNR